MSKAKIILEVDGNIHEIVDSIMTHCEMDDISVSYITVSDIPKDTKKDKIDWREVKKSFRFLPFTDKHFEYSMNKRLLGRIENNKILIFIPGFFIRIYKDGTWTLGPDCDGG